MYRNRNMNAQTVAVVDLNNKIVRVCETTKRGNFS